MKHLFLAASLATFLSAGPAAVLAQDSKVDDDPLVATVNGHEIRPAASIGIAEFAGSDDVPTSLLRLADDAMYTAKRSASTQICVARDGVIEEVF